MGSWRRWGSVVLAALCLLTGSATSLAQVEEPDDETRSAARQMARDGLELMNAENYEAAEELLRRAYELVPAPTVAVLRGRALEELGRLIEAQESYEAARRVPEDKNTPPAFREAKTEAAERLEKLRKEIPLLTIKVTGIEPSDERLEIRLDDKEVPGELLEVRRPIDPGQHMVVAAFNETVHDTRWVTLERGEHIKVLMRVDAPQEVAPPPPPPPLPTPQGLPYQEKIGWGALAVGGSGFVAGFVSGGIMLHRKGQLDDACRPTCPSDLEAELKTFRRSRTASAVGYGVGFTGLAVGAALLLTLPPDESTSDAQKRKSPEKSGGKSGGNKRRLFARIGPGGISVGGELP